MAKPPVAARATAALVFVLVEALAVDVPLLLLPEVLVAVLVMVAFERVEEIFEEAVDVTTATEELDAEVAVMFAEVAVTDMTEVAVPIVSLIVVVDVKLPVADAEETLLEPVVPVIWNGKEYWKVVGAESREILKP